MGPNGSYGYSADEVIGRSVNVAHSEDRHDEEQGTSKRASGAARALSIYETLRRRKDGSLLDVSLTVSPIRTVRRRSYRGREDRLAT